MKENKSNFTNEKNESTNAKFIIHNYFVNMGDADELFNVDCTPKTERKNHQEFLKGQFSMTEPEFPKGVSYKNLESIFTNKVDYEAMRRLSSMEKFALFVTAFYPQYIERLCKDCHISPDGFRKMAEIGANKFIKYRNKHSKQAKNEFKNFKKNYYKKGGDSNE